MDRLAAPAASPVTPSITRLGRRLVVAQPDGTCLEALHLHPALASSANFVRALRKSAAALQSFRYPASAGPVLLQEDGGLAVASPSRPGLTLAEVLADCEARARPLTTSSVLYLLREVIAAVRAQQAHRSRTWHGQITPEHVRVAPDLRVVVTDHVFGAAFAALPFSSAAEMWRQWGTAVPASNALPRFGPKTDQLQIGVLALSLLLGRTLREDEYPGKVPQLLADASETNLLGEPIALGASLRRWVERALWLSEKGPFPTMGSMDQQLGDLLSDELGYVAVPIGSDFDIAPDADAASPPVAAEVLPMAGDEVVSMADDAEVSGSTPKAAEDVTAPAAADSEEAVEEPDLPAPVEALSPDIEVMLAESDVLDAVADWRASHGSPAVATEAEEDAAPGVFGWDLEEPGTAWSEAPAPVFDLAVGEDGEAALWTIEMPAGTAEAEGAVPAEEPRSVDVPVPVLAEVPRYAPWRRVAAAADVAVPEAPAPADASGPDVSGADESPAPAPEEEAAPALAVPAYEWLAENAVPIRAPVHDDLAPVAAEPTPEPEPAIIEEWTSAMEPTASVEPGASVKPAACVEPVVAADIANASPAEPSAGHVTEAGGTPAILAAPVARPGAQLRPAVPSTVQRGAMPGSLFGASLGADNDDVFEFEGGAHSGVLFGSESPAVSNDVPPSRRWMAIAAAVACIVALAGVAWQWSRPAADVAGDNASDVATPAGEGEAAAPVAGTAAPGGPRGGLRITSVPTGVRVVIDGTERGKTPLTVDDLAPGEHAVVVENAVHRVERRVTVGDGETTGLDIPVSGRLLITSPLPVKVHDGGRLVGESSSRRLELAAGRRRIEVVNDAVSYRESFDINVPPGGTARVSVVPPNGLLHLTADERVAVRIDGRPVGMTPVASVSVPLGEHQITFTHREFGEQTYTVVVSLNSPNRLHATFVPPRPMLPRSTRRR